MSDIFISHSTRNNDFTRWLAARLREESFNVWVDLDSIREGERWLRSIQAAIEASKAVVLVLSQASHDSQWVEGEILLAIELKKPLYIALIEDVSPLPIHLINRQFSNFLDDAPDAREKALQKLIRAIRDETAQPSDEDDLTPDRETFFKFLEQIPGDSVIRTAEAVFELAQTEADAITFGGKVTPGFHARVNLGENNAITIFSLWAYRRNPAVQVQFQYLCKHAPYDDDDLRRSTLQSLNRIMPADAPLYDDQADRRPTIPLDALNSPENLALFRQIMREMIDNLHGN